MMTLVLKVLCILGPSFGVPTAAITNRQARLSLMEAVPSYYVSNINGNPGTYSFGYDIADPASGQNQYRTEERYPNGTVVGSYGYVDLQGRPYRFKYIADERGYRVSRERQSQLQYLPPNSRSTTEPSITWKRPKKKPNNNFNTNNNVQKPTNFFYSRKRPSVYKLY